MDIEKKKAPLPHELIEEILLRLPVKSLVRFRSISKPWQSLISGSYFTKSHFDLAVTHTNKLLCVEPFHSEARVIAVDTSIRRDCAVIQLPMPYDFNLRIMGSCRGFILLVNYTHLLLWNPSTGVHKTLSYSSVASNVLRSDLDKTFCFRYGFGHDISNDDYLIVIGWHELCETEEVETHLEFFSTRTNSWKEIESTNFPCLFSLVRSDSSGAFFNGGIHWLATNHGRAQVIIAFDLAGKNFFEILLPDKTGGVFYHLKLLGGCLGVCYTEGNDKAEIWIMKEYNVQSSWTKLNVVLPNSLSTCTPLCITKGGELVAINDRGHLVKFNGKGKYVVTRLSRHAHDGYVY